MHDAFDERCRFWFNAFIDLSHIKSSLSVAARSPSSAREQPGSDRHINLGKVTATTLNVCYRIVSVVSCLHDKQHANTSRGLTLPEDHAGFAFHAA